MKRNIDLNDLKNILKYNLVKSRYNLHVLRKYILYINSNLRSPLYISCKEGTLLIAKQSYFLVSFLLFIIYRKLNTLFFVCFKDAIKLGNKHVWIVYCWTKHENLEVEIKIISVGYIWALEKKNLLIESIKFSTFI